VLDGNAHLVAFYFVARTRLKRKKFCGE
jgi:hypothetical protein